MFFPALRLLVRKKTSGKAICWRHQWALSRFGARLRILNLIAWLCQLCYKYIWAIQVCAKGINGFSAILVINKVFILPILVLHMQIWHGCCTLVLNCVCFLEEATFSSLLTQPSTKTLHNLMFRSTVPAVTAINTVTYKVSNFGQAINTVNTGV